MERHPLSQLFDTARAPLPAVSLACVCLTEQIVGALQAQRPQVKLGIGDA